MSRTEFHFLTIGLLLIGAAFPATAAPADVLTILIKSSPAGASESVTAARRIAGTLAALGHIVTHPAIDNSNLRSADAVIIVTGGVETLQGTYVSVSTLSLHAAILTGNPLRIVARLDKVGENRWRLPSNCAAACRIALARRKTQLAAALLAARVAVRLNALHRSGQIVTKGREDPDITLSFRDFDAASLADMERFLRKFPEAGSLRMIRNDRTQTSYRDRYTATASTLRGDLRRALNHLRIAADIDRDGRKLVIRKNQSAANTASTDW